MEKVSGFASLSGESIRFQGGLVESTSPPRPMRADARRNYDRIVEVAREAFTEYGPEAPLDDIARRAGVGAGTLYRHFACREALIEAVYRADIERLCNRAFELLEGEDALNTWMRELVRFVADKRGLSQTLKSAIDRGSETFVLCRTLMNDAIEALLAPAQAAGEVRRDIEPRDLLLMGHGIGVASENNPEATPRLLAVMLDGLRPRRSE